MKTSDSWQNSSNAAPEWQARSLRRRGRDLEVAYPLEGLVRSVESLQARSADLRHNGRSPIIQGVTNGIVCLPCRR